MVPWKLLLVVFVVIIRGILRLFSGIYTCKFISIQFTSYILQNTTSNTNVGEIGKTFPSWRVHMEIFIPHFTEISRSSKWGHMNMPEHKLLNFSKRKKKGNFRKRKVFFLYVPLTVKMQKHSTQQRNVISVDNFGTETIFLRRVIPSWLICVKSSFPDLVSSHSRDVIISIPWILFFVRAIFVLGDETLGTRLVYAREAWGWLQQVRLFSSYMKIEVIQHGGCFWSFSPSKFRNQIWQKKISEQVQRIWGRLKCYVNLQAIIQFNIELCCYT